jgi:glucose-1-phosphate thymidylyltransferase
MKSLLLASGFGTRLYPLNVNKAKGFIDYKGKALISHLVHKIPQDIPILVNTNKKFESDFRLWQKNIDRNITIYAEPVLHEKQAFGAIGSIEYCIKTQNIAEDLLVIASDNYFEFDLRRFFASYNGKNTLVAVHDIGDKNKASHYGVVKLDGNKIVELEEKPAQPKYSLIAIACYIFPQRIFPLLTQYCSEGKRDNLGGFIAYLIAKDEVRAYVFNESWMDIGSAEIYKSIKKSKS